MKQNIIKFSLVVISVLFMLLTTSVVNAQIKHEVIVSNGAFTPSTLSINIGDTVKWRIVEGFHNVNGTVNTFPTNPESFGNSPGSSWEYSHVFETVGLYDYKCDIHSSMTGTIEVLNPLQIINNEKLYDEINIYPIPAKSSLNIKLSKNYADKISSISFFNIIGNELLRFENISQEINIELDNFSKGIYIIQFSNNSTLLESKKIMIE